MKNSIALVIMLASSAAFADGFVCEGKKTGLNFKMYNKTMTATRTGAVMVVSDPKVAYGRKTIATFSDVQGLLASEGARYVANVDSRYTTVGRIGENIAGTKLGELRTIDVAIDFNYYYDTPSNKGEKYAGKVTYVKENGERKTENLACVRYKKN